MRATIWPAIFLAAIAGFVDALGYLTLAHVFTAHMSGNAAALGAHLGQMHCREALLRAAPLPAFLFGAAAAAASEHVTARQSWPMRLAPAFALELCCLGAFVWFCPAEMNLTTASPRFFSLMSLLAAAMGLQSATLRRAGGRRVRTTFISGMLINTTDELIASAFAPSCGNAEQPSARAHRRNAFMFGLIFTSFMFGAVAGSMARTRFGASAMLLPAAGLVIVIVDDLVQGSRQHTR